MAECSLEQVDKRFGRVHALRELSLEARDGELLVILGATGAGKTTLLRVIAGLERAERGRVSIAGRPVDGLPPAERDVAMVFQNFSLYPRLTVRANLSFPLEAPLRRVPRDEVARRVSWAAELLHITPLLDRKPATLSGGEQQRVAIGRCIVREPRLFLLDEPLANLDAKLRESMRLELLRLQRRLATTMLFVTHDHTEAMSLGDRIAVLREGRLLQLGKPDEVYRRPACLTVAELLGSPPINVLPAAGGGGRWTAFGGAIVAECRPAPVPRVLLAVRPHDVDVATDDGAAANARIELNENLGAERLLVLVNHAGERLRACVASSTHLQRGQAVRVSARPGSVLAFDADTGARVD